jgi:hypothetical protein
MTAEVLQTLTMPIRKVKPIIREELEGPMSNIPTEFSPEKHLSFDEPPKTLSLSTLGFPDNVGVSPVGVSEPFPLFNEEAIRIMRSELFQKEVWENCMHSTDFAGCQIRGHCPK